MAEPRPTPLCLFIVAAFSQHSEALAWARQRLESLCGPIVLASKPFPFVQTGYYERSMGSGLLKQLLAFRHRVPADDLPRLKLATNALERELTTTAVYPEERPLNLDPGLLTLGKFMLATMKDQAQRIYVGQGVFAEVTLWYREGQFQAWPWTYADYRQECVHNFLQQARAYLYELIEADRREG